MAAGAAALGIMGCTPSTPTYHRAAYTPDVENQVQYAFRTMASTLPANEGEPRGPVVCGTGFVSCQQKVTGGTFYWADGAGTTAVLGAINEEWERAGGTHGTYGAPVADALCTDAGCHQDFASGTLVSGPDGVVVLDPAFAEAWQASGAESGTWGAPTAAATCGADGACTQPFVSGLGVASAGSATLLSPEFGAYWTAQGGSTGALGLPTGGQECGLWANACRQQFAGGWVYSSPGGGTHRVLPQLLDAWTSAGADAGAWGLPTGEPACTPSGTTCRQAFGGGEVTWRSDVGILDCSVQACVALTFDDGPGADTPRLLDVLDAAGAQATFFVQGNHIAGNEAVIQRADALFNDVGSHATTHTPLVDLDAAAQQAEWSTCVSQLEGILGHRVTYGRPPYGLFNADTTATATAVGLHLVWWDIDSLDWSLLDPQATIDLIMGKVGRGDVILMHDTHATTVDAVGPLIEQLRAAGYVPVSLSELSSSGPPG